MSIRTFRWMMCFFVGQIVLATAARAATPDEIDKALKKSVTFLYAQQNPQGNWDHILKPGANGKWSGDVKQEGGPTALAVFALLSAGEDPKDPRLARAIDYLKHVQSQGIYAVGLRANVMAMLPFTPEVRQVIFHDGEFLKNSMHGGKEVTKRGFYGYGPNPKQGADRSTSQFAVLGMWGFAAAGNDIGEDYWKVVDTAWRKAQLDDGGWNYGTPRPASSVSMTSAGIATLFITTEYMHAVDFSGCKGSYVDENLNKALKWVGDNFQSVFGYDYPLYALYGVERCAEAGGVKYFGTSNWFDLGADWIVKGQTENGAWRGSSIPDTSFAVLFLARGRAAVAISKLGYTLENVDTSKPENAATIGNWNQRPRDVANISRWAGRQQERTLNWQFVTLDGPADELSDSAIMYIAGNQPLQFKEEERAKLRQFVEEGGLIVANADCAGVKFTESMKKLGSQLFPAYEFRQLPPDHVMFTNEQFAGSAWKLKPAVLGLSNGSRELMLIIPNADPARYWQMHLLKGHEESHELMADIFAYAIGLSKNLHKGEGHIVRAKADVAAARTTKLARLQYPGNWNPEPGGWRRLAAVVHNQQKLDLAIETVDLGKGKLDKTFPLAHLTGTVNYKLLPEMKSELKKYIEGGGTLLVDSCGGSVPFANDIEAQLCDIFTTAGKSMPTLSISHSVFATAYPPAAAITQVDYRPYARKLLGGDFKAPRLRGVQIGDRTAIYFSAEDLSTGLVGHDVDGITGYSPRTATAIVEQIVLSTAPKSMEVATDGKPAEAGTITKKPDDATAPEMKASENKPADPKPTDVAPEAAGDKKPTTGPTTKPTDLAPELAPELKDEAPKK